MPPFGRSTLHLPPHVVGEALLRLPKKMVVRTTILPAPATPAATPPMTPIYQQVMKAAPKQFAGLEGRIEVIASPGNGGRPVVIFIPKSFDVSKPATIVTHFSGKNFNMGTEAKSTGLVGRLKSEATRQNAIWILPQGYLTEPTDRWMRADQNESFAALQKDALQAISASLGETPSVVTRVVSAHSGGGSALQNAISASDFYADKLLLLDCFYETRGNNWWQTIAKWLTARPQTKVTYFHSTNEYKRVQEFESLVRPTLKDQLQVSRSPTWHGGLPKAHLTATP